MKITAISSTYEIRGLEDLVGGDMLLYIQFASKRNTFRTVVRINRKIESTHTTEPPAFGSQDTDNRTAKLLYHEDHIVGCYFDVPEIILIGNFILTRNEETDSETDEIFGYLLSQRA